MPALPSGQKMWLAYPEGVVTVRIVSEGTGLRVMRKRPRKPYVVRDDDGDEFVVAVKELFDSPRDAEVERFERGWSDDEEETEDDDDEGEEEDDSDGEEEAPDDEDDECEDGD